VDLHPAGALRSGALAIQGNRQVGFVSVGGINFDHASMWTGTAASWVDLNPIGATISRANGVYADQQVGYVQVNGFNRASLWNGTAASWVDLSAYLPAGFTTYSEADGIWSDGSFTYIAGKGFNSLTNQEEALLWSQPIPEPSTFALIGLGVLAIARRRAKRGLALVEPVPSLVSNLS